MSWFHTRTHPCETASPLLLSNGVPWIAARPPPGQSLMTGENPDKP